MSEFTGERLVPGEVDADLWNEHVSRYVFAASFCLPGSRVVDAGCGTGYGSTVLNPGAGLVLGVDLSVDAVSYASRRYGATGVRFVAGRCEALPVADESSDLVVAFEVIEHLEGWREFLVECRRVLAPGGMLFVSTPNKSFYTESRGDAGPNPFHTHEFDFGEFCAELDSVFPHVRIFGQNHAGSIAFSAVGEPGVTVRLESLHFDPRDSGFFVAVCGKGPLPTIPNFIYVPETANVLLERERHIRLLRDELDVKNSELAGMHSDLTGLVELHRRQEEELSRSNMWAESQNRRIAEQDATIAELQNELQRSNSWAQSLDGELQKRIGRIVALQQEIAAEQARASSEIERLGIELYAEQVRAAAEIERLAVELDSRTVWARDLDAQLAGQVAELGRCMDALHAAEQTLDERTKWAQSLDTQLAETSAQLATASAKLASYEESRWVKLGGAIHVGPLSK